MKLPPARATIAIVALTCVAYLITSFLGLQAIAPDAAGFIPARVGDASADASLYLAPLTATLVHGNLIHLAFNMVMLGFCGRYVEASIGSGGVVILYVVGAYAAAAAQYALAPSSTVAMIGASGAVSAIIGTYALLYGRRRVGPANRRSAHWLQIIWLAAAWIGLQALIALSGGSLPGVPQGSGIAVAAHVGGFVAGLLLARPLLLFRYRHA